MDTIYSTYLDYYYLPHYKTFIDILKSKLPSFDFVTETDYKFNVKGECIKREYFNGKWTLIPIKSDCGVASLRVLSRIKTNRCVCSRQAVEKLYLPQIYKGQLDKFYVTDNDDKLLAYKFNAKSHSKGSKIKMVMRDANWHLQSCSSITSCVCIDLLNDPERIFHDTPSQISVDDRIWYFNVLALKNLKHYSLKNNGHFRDCNKEFDCACSMVEKNPEQFFNVPPKNRFRIPTPTEIRNLQEKWKSLNNNIKKFNIACRILGMILKFVKTESNGHHLNICGIFCACNCRETLNNPAEYFIYKYKLIFRQSNVRNEKINKYWHFENCSIVNMFRNIYVKFPEYVECDCDIFYYYE